MALSEEKKALYKAGLRGVNVDVVKATKSKEFFDTYKNILKNGISSAPKSSATSSGKHSAAQESSSVKQDTKKTAVDRLWDRGSNTPKKSASDEARSEVVKARRNTEQKQKELEDYQNSELDWTNSAARQLYEQGEKQKKQDIAKAQAEQNAAVANFDRVQMDSMSEEDRALIDEYIRREDTASDPLATGTDEIVDQFVNQNSGVDEKRLKQLVETRRRELNAQRMQETQEKAQAEVNDDWMSATFANLKTIPANLMSGLMGTMSTVHDLANRDERYSGLDPNSMGNQLNVYSGAVRGQTQQNIVGDGSSLARRGLGVLYQAGMSAADTGARAAVGGALGLGAGAGATIAGLNTFSQTMSDASARGATPEQALALAVTTAGIEAATEKVPLDNLIKVSKGGGAKSLIMNILRQAGIEATEEELSLIGTTLADAAIMQEKSEYNQTVAEYMAQGMTEEQAREQANWGLVQEAAEMAIVAGIAGGIGGFGAAKANAYMNGDLDTAIQMTIGMETAEDTAQKAAQQPQTEQNPQDVNVDVQKETAAQETQEVQKQQTPQEQEQAILKATGETPAENAPKPEPDMKTEGQKLMEQGVQKTLGTEPVADTAKAESAQREVTKNVSVQDGQAENAESRPVESAQPAATANAEQTKGMQNAPSGDIGKSRTFTNTGIRSADEDIRKSYRETMKENPSAADYDVKHNADTKATAEQRTETLEKANAEYEYLMGAGNWTAEDNVTAELAIKKMLREGGDESAGKIADLKQKRKAVNKDAGELIQSNRIIGTMKSAVDTYTALDTFYTGIDKISEGDSTFKSKKGSSFENWKNGIKEQATRIAIAIEMVDDGDAGTMRDIIRQISRERGTTAWFGTSDRMTSAANRILKKLDFETLKKIANTQLAAMPDDFKRRSKTEVIMAIRKQNMLTSFKTFARNIAGNGATGLMDSISDSAGGQLVDALLSKITGKRTVGNDLTKGKAYVNAAKDAMDFASLCVELNIPIETDVDASYASATGDGGDGKYVGKTFRSQGNFAMRALYAYQKYMSYALEVSDKIFEGGTNAAVAESLRNLKNSGLSDADIQELGEYTANRRTFKDATWKDADGKEHGAVLSRKAQAIKQPFGVVGDVAMPYAKVPMNVAQTGIDYTAGVAKGVGEIASIIWDVNHGKEISVARQRQAATDFGRGLTGTALIGLFTTAAAKGIIAVHNDKDKNKKALEQSEGLSGAQINWSAWERSMNGESEEWQDGDVLSSLDFLEPFNTQLYLSCELAKEDTMQGILKSYPKSTFWAVRDAFMDSPMVQGITDIADLISGVKDAETPEDIGNEVAGYAGDVASSFVPQVVRQAAQVKDGYYRDTRGTNAAEYAKNNFLNAIPGASETLPKKISGLGEEQERLDWVSTFFDPTNTQTYRKNGVSGYLDELSGKTGDTSIYPERQAPMSVKNVDGETITLDGNQRETYQREYGHRVNRYYGALLVNEDFGSMPDDLKIECLNKAKEYAKGHARATVSDFREVKEGSAQDVGKEIVRDVVISELGKAIASLETAWEYGYDTQKRFANLEASYDNINKLTGESQEKAKEDLTGDSAKYVEVRDNGVSTADYLTALKNVKNVEGTGEVNKKTGKRTVREIDIRGAIADSVLPDAVTDKLMHAYMPDYDPDAKTKQKTELKYDYARQELNLSPQEYVGTYSVQLDGGKKNEKIQEWVDMGYSRTMANNLYRLYAATGKTKIDVVKWHEGK